MQKPELKIEERSGLDHATVEADGDGVILCIVTTDNKVVRYTISKRTAAALGGALIRKAGH